MARVPFRIEKLHIRNFRSIDDLDLEFPADEHEPGGFAVIAGDNGCGKTSVLEAILLVLGRRDLLPEDAAPLEEQVRFGAAGFEVVTTARPFESGAQPIVLEANATILGSPASRVGLVPRSPGGALYVSDVPTFPFWKAIGELKPSVEYFLRAVSPKPSARALCPEKRPLCAKLTGSWI
jgi:energy-coupling factor transporter ATP-binding protein EcfA2